MASGIKIEGLKELTNTISQLPVKVQKVVDAELTDGAQKIAKLAKQLAPNYEATLIRSISADTNTPLHKEVVASVFYAPYIEFGTGKKVKIPSGLEAIAAQFQNQPKRGTFDEMVNSLAEWIRKKGILTNGKVGRKRKDDTYRLAAYWMAIRILQNGIKAHPFFFPAYETYKQEIKNNIQKAIGG